MRQIVARLVCRISSHDWWSLAYPPARRWECHRCGAIVEEAVRLGHVPVRPAHAAEPAPAAQPSRPDREGSSGTR